MCPMHHGHRSCMCTVVRCSLRCSGYHTALSAAAAAMWIVLPASQMNSGTFAKPLRVFVRLLLRSLAALGLTSDHQIQDSPLTSHTGPCTNDGMLNKLLEGVSRNVACFREEHVAQLNITSCVCRMEP